jgi:hypothetical protein
MDDTSMIRILLAGDSPQSFCFCQKHLERNGPLVIQILPRAAFCK